MSRVYVGTAGWSLPKEYADHFPEEGTHLARYAQGFTGVEINSSFYKPHRQSTYARWSASVPPDFRFAVKVPKEITHQLKLVGATPALERFLAEVSELGVNLGPLLVQLPPSLVFEMQTAQSFFSDLRERFTGHIVCEPRHPDWFRTEATQILTDFHIARIAADPPPVPQGAKPGGWRGVTYFRLHGWPRMYYSAYSERDLTDLAQSLNKELQTGPVWCIFDNTALGAATGDALDIAKRLKQGLDTY